MLSCFLLSVAIQEKNVAQDFLHPRRNHFVLVVFALAFSVSVPFAADSHLTLNGRAHYKRFLIFAVHLNIRFDYNAPAVWQFPSVHVHIEEHLPLDQ
jgi:hypothetical protein